MEFERQQFYINPPGENSSEEEWRIWQHRDDLKARAAKAAYTKSLERGDPSKELPIYSTQSFPVKINGVYIQQDVTVGLSGDFENGNGNFEIMVGPTQDRHYQQRGKRGGARRRTRKSRHADRASRFIRARK